MAQDSSAPVRKGREVGSLEVIPKAALRGEKSAKTLGLVFVGCVLPSLVVSYHWDTALTTVPTSCFVHQLLSAWTTIAYSSLTLVEGGIELGQFRVFWRCEGRWHTERKKLCTCPRSVLMGAFEICSMISVLHGQRLCTLESTKMDLRVLLTAVSEG